MSVCIEWLCNTSSNNTRTSTSDSAHQSRSPTDINNKSSIAATKTTAPITMSGSNNTDIDEVPSNVSSVSVLRYEDGLIVEEKITTETDESKSSPSAQQKAKAATSTTDSSTKQKKNIPLFSFFGNHKKQTTAKMSISTANKMTSNGAVTDVDGDELSIMELPSPEDIVGNRESVMNGGGGGSSFFGTSNSSSGHTSIDNSKPGSHAQSTSSLYGRPLPIPELKEYFDMKEINDDDDDDNELDLLEEGGLIWYSNIVPDDYDSQFKTKGTLKMLPTKFYDEKNQRIKPRRGNLSVRECDFFTSLVKVNIRKKPNSDNNDNRDSMLTQQRHDGDEFDEGHADDDSDFKIFDSKLKIFDDYSSVGDGVLGDKSEVYVDSKEKNKRQYSKWFFSGVLNGWPGLKHLELVKIEYKLNVVPGWRTHWDSAMNPKDVAPTFPTKVMGLMEVRAKLREPGWSAEGWSKDSPGYVLYYNGPDTRKVPRMLYGTNIIREFENDRRSDVQKVGWNDYKVQPSPKCVHVHMISHRYATTKEKWKDKLSYHSFAFLEWDHGKYCTVVELAFLNGLGGYNARSNHTEDRDAPVTSMLKTFPPEMVKPWKDTLSEIRCIDVKAKNVSEYLEFMGRHTGKQREMYFLDVRHTFSHPVRLTFCSQEQIVQYLINYIRRGRTYSEIRKNCQTFCADFCAFLAGKKDVQPFHPLNRFEYRNQTHYFMYESTMYDQH